MFAPMMDRWQRNCIKRQHSGYTPPGVVRRKFLSDLNPHPPKPRATQTGMADLVGRASEAMRTLYRPINIPSCWPVTQEWDVGTGGEVRRQVTWTVGKFVPRTGLVDNDLFNYDGSASTTITTSDSISVDNNLFVVNSWTDGTAASTTDRIYWPIEGVTTGNDIINGSTIISYPGGVVQLNPDPKKLKEDQFRYKMKQQITGGAPLNHRGAQSRATHRPADFSQVSPSEIIALRLLRGMLNEEEWKRYLRYGFIIVRGESGLVYQIVRNQSHVRVYRSGTKVAELCIYVQGNVPPTDSVIAKKVMVECSEKDLWHKANIHGQSKWPTKYQPTEEELVQLAA